MKDFLLDETNIDNLAQSMMPSEQAQDPYALHLPESQRQNMNGFQDLVDKMCSSMEPGQELNQKSIDDVSELISVFFRYTNRR